MSLPSAGNFIAQLGTTRLIFDGDHWFSEPQDSPLLPLLELETPKHHGQHLEAPFVGRKILDALFAGQWTLITSGSVIWPDDLPPDAID